MNTISIVNSQEVSIAMKVNGNVISRNNLDFGRALDAEYLPYLEALLRENSLALKDIGGWSVGLGPGSFAGIRFALALVKGICGVTGAKTRGIPDSFAIATAWLKNNAFDGKIGVVTDARCNCAFVTVYDVQAGRVIPVEAPILMKKDDIWPAWADCGVYLTSTPDVRANMPEAFASRVVDCPPAQAVDILDADETLFPWMPTPDIEPLYVRPPA